MEPIFIDIESIPPQTGNHLERIKAGIKAPGQYKKADSIAQWLAENAESAAMEQFGKLALDGLYGQVCVICFAVGDDPVTMRRLDVISTPTEADLIRSTFMAIDVMATDGSGVPRMLTPVGHNVEFDMRFLFQRAVRYGIPVPRALRLAFDPAKGRYNVEDTMQIWAGRDYVKLKELSRELLDDGSDDIDGSEVAKVWQTDPDAVVTHCIRDVERVRSLYRRIRAVL